MMNKHFNIIFPLLHLISAVFFLSGCSVTQNYQRPDIITDSLYNNTSAADSANISNISWEKIFNDSTLISLIRTGLSNNPDLKIAIERIKESEAYLKQSGADKLPTLDLTVGSSVSRLSKNSLEGSNPDVPDPLANYRAGFYSTWEADLWGKLNSAQKGAYAELLKSKDLKKAVQTRLIANIATGYYSLLRYNSDVSITELTIINREEDLETMKALKKAALVTEAAVKQSEAQVYGAKVLLPQLKKLINITENSLNLLLGRMPQKIVSGDLENSPQLYIDTLIGYPSQLLINRPDVMASEQSLISAFQNSNVARANFYPKFSITAALGLESFDAGKLFLFPGSIFANAFGQIIQPVFDKRKNRTQLEVSLARQQSAAYSYKLSFLTAVSEVSNALVNYKLSTEIIDLYSKEKNSLETALEYSRELLKNGYADYLEVLRAEDFLLRSRFNYSNARLEQLHSGVELYRSLGGGWK